MNSQRLNPAPVCRNPSRKRDEYGCDHGVGPYQNGKSVRNVSRVGVTDLGGGNSINNREISLSSINTSRCHAPAIALRLRTREGVCDVFARRIRFASPVRRHPIGPRSRTFAPCGVPFRPLDKYATAAYAPTRANVAYSREIPPVVGTSPRFHAGEVCGNSSRLRHSLFCLSDQTPKPRSERKSHVGFYPS